MTATIINFPVADWRKSTTTIAATGRVIESWEAIKDDWRAIILLDDDGFYWRAYVAVQHRKPTPHQKFRPKVEWTFAPSLLLAKASAKSFIAA